MTCPHKTHDEHLLELIDILAKRAQDGGLGLADCAESPLMKLREKIVNSDREARGYREFCPD